MANDGTLTNTDNVDDDGTLSLSKVNNMDTIRVDDGAGGTNTFLITGSNDGGLSVFEVASDGTLTNTDNVADDGTMYLAATDAVETHTINGVSYVFTGGAEDGISIFEIDSSGTLTNVGNLGDDAVLNLNNIEDLYVAPHNGDMVLWVAAFDEGLDAYRIDIDGGTGAVTLTRIAEFDKNTYETDDLFALDGEQGFIVAADYVSNSITSYTAPCFAPGTMISTPEGQRNVEDLRPGDLVSTADRGPMPVRWVHASDQPLEDVDLESKPVLIRAGAFGPGCPDSDLIVSPQHRVLLGGFGQCDGVFRNQVLVPSKALVRLPRVRFMRGKRSIRWIHFATATHQLVYANGCVCESLLIGPVVLAQLSAQVFSEVTEIFGKPDGTGAALNGPPARPLVGAGQVKDFLEKRRRPPLPLPDHECAE